MRFSEAWLREWVNPPIGTDELADQLSMAGLEVDSVEPAAPAFTGVVVGRVLAREQHPDADKLSICRVDVGDGGDPLQIVCGAKNVAADMLVPVAVVGAVLPGDFRIKKAKLRGIESSGMICSASELGLAESSDGIMVLPTDAPPGAGFRDYLKLDDACIEVDLTPDRGDCLSVAGIAREVAVLNREPLTPVAIGDVAPTIDDQFPVDVAAPSGCPRYLCRVLRGIDAGARTPGWMVEKLRRSGVRAISPVVDVTNYVLLELGQPMHGFDLSKLSGGVRVRMADADEQLTLLDGSEVKLTADTLVIADANGPLALAGIMGGAESGVVAGATRDILLEAAFFAPLAIAGKARGYGLHTDSSHRFERGVDPMLQRQAMERATGLLLEIVGGEPGPIVEVASETDLPRPAAIDLRRDRVLRVLGVKVADADIEDYLSRLGMEVRATAQGWAVTPPSSRFDIAIEVDLIEEIGRIHGYANIPENLSAAPVSVSARSEASFRLEGAKATLVDRGFQEVITYSFISPQLAAKITPGAGEIRLANPISADLAVMRASLWPGLLSALQTNLARQQNRVRIFESGLAFRGEGRTLTQEPTLAGLAYGSVTAEQWGEPSRPVDFYDVKSDVEEIIGQVANFSEFSFHPTEIEALHPGQSAAIFRGDVRVGAIGMLHPALQTELDLPGNVFLFELSISGLERGRIPMFQPVSRYTASRRDFAVVVERNVPYARIRAVAEGAASDLIRDIGLFDVYTGENIDSGLKSLALSLILQDSSKTLTDGEVDQAVAPVLAALQAELGAQLRE